MEGRSGYMKFMAGNRDIEDWTRKQGAHDTDRMHDHLVLAAYDRPPKGRSAIQQQEANALVEAAQRNRLSVPEKLAQIGTLAGHPASSRMGAALEASALIHALNHDPTPEGLGKEGCMAAISRYVIEPHLSESGLKMPHFVDSHAFLAYVGKHPELATIATKSQRDIKAADLQPGDIIIGEKSTGNHVMVVTRVPEFWGYPRGAMMLCGNTGLAMPDGPPYPHFRAAQEVIGPGTDQYNYHHGQLNSQMRTNPYLGGNFKIVRFHD
jgi:hypothetical protein